MKRNLQEGKSLDLDKEVRGKLKNFTVGDKITGIVDPDGNPGEIDILKAHFQQSLRDGLICYITYRYTDLSSGESSVDTVNVRQFGRVYIKED